MKKYAMRIHTRSGKDFFRVESSRTLFRDWVVANLSTINKSSFIDVLDSSGVATFLKTDNIENIYVSNDASQEDKQ